MMLATRFTTGSPTSAGSSSTGDVASGTFKSELVTLVSSAFMVGLAWASTEK